MKRIFVILLLVGLICLPASATVQAYAKTKTTGDGNVGQEFVFTFEYFNTSEVVATTRVTATGAEAVLTETTDYTITTTGSNPYTGGTLTLVGSLAATSTLTVSRSTPQLQETDLVTSGALAAETLEDQYDKLVMQIQDLQEQIDRSLRIPITDGSTVEAACELDDAIQRASCYLTFDANGLPTATATAITGSTASTFGASLIDDANAAAALTTLSISAFAQTMLDDADAAAVATTLGLSSLNLIDEDSFATNSATRPPSQQSVLALVTTTAATMASKTLTSPVLNTGVSGTAVLDEDAMGSDSATQLATQQSIKAYVDTNRARITGEVLQIVNVMDGAVATGTTAMVMDDTIPQKTEGDEYMTLAITPTSATTLLKIDVVVNLTHTNAGNGLIVALFQDTTANALAAASVAPGDDANALIQVRFTHWMTSGTSSSTTFKVRAGSSAAGATTTFNGASGARLFGGVCASSVTITEIAD